MQGHSATQPSAGDWTWFEHGFAGLAKRHNPLLGQLVSTGRLRLAFAESALDCVDIRSACLVGGALARNQSVCVGLPDAHPRRPAFLFAYALLSHWWKAREFTADHRPVLYCGVEIGIREQLSQVSVSGMFGSLADVFSQTHLARGSHIVDHSSGANRAVDLPAVVTAYSPADPHALLEQLRPAWIAVDFSNAPSLSWLRELLETARLKGMPVVGWGTNPLSDALRQFEAHRVLRWPSVRAFGARGTFAKDERTELLFQPYIVTKISPIIPVAGYLSTHNDALAQASQLLQPLSKAKLGTVLHSAVQQHWRLVRAVESLAVPLPLYEAEASKFWGLAPIERLESICAHLRSMLDNHHHEQALTLENVGRLLDVAIGVLKETGPPLWTALTALVHQEAPAGDARVFVFPTKSRKELFILSLLANLNIVEGDLVELRNWVMTLEELGSLEPECSPLTADRIVPKTLSILPTFVGMPSALHLPKLTPVLLAEETAILVHGHQRRLLNYRIGQLSRDMSADIDAASTLIADLVPLAGPEPGMSVQKRVVSAAVIALEVEGPRPKQSGSETPASLWIPGSESDEIDRLFEADESDQEAQDNPDVQAEPVHDIGAYLDSAWEIEFSGGWRGVFEPSDRLNVVSGATIGARYVRALRPKDTVLIIPHQRRQTLYSLVISRVHQHKNMQVPLALLRRWHDELRSGFDRWRQRGAFFISDADAAALLLAEIRKLGSGLRSGLAIQFWVRNVTLAPDDKEDLRRVAEVLGLAFTREHYARIDAAASRIRGLHRGLSIRLKHWLEDRAKGMAESHDAVLLDKDLGLTFGDIRASFVIADIVRIHEVQGTFLRSALGVVERRHVT